MKIHIQVKTDSKTDHMWAGKALKNNSEHKNKLLLASDPLKKF